MGAACQHCGNSLAGKRADAKFCCGNCKLKAHRGEVGRIEDVPSGLVINRPIRNMLVEANRLNPQDEGNPQKVREAFNLFIADQAKKYA
ncbi:hypothetical protein A9174_24995 [Mesorhizobium loti NZP2037]|nr:hypothetical protein [Mesorhizobium loti]ANN59652.1 hypothetical protein A9174_24995 [Mesorhizobium loti NZP2037]